jgi:murein DD-endopeptidase MepM/ murein hydrolase activator NlpD
MITRPDLASRQKIRRAIFLLLIAGLGAAMALRFHPRREPVAVVPVFRDLKLAEAIELKLRIGPGDFFAGVLERAGLSAPEAARLIDGIRPAYDLASIRSGRTLTLFFESGKLRNLVYPIDRDTYLAGEADGQGGYRGRVIAVPYQVRREVVRIRIENSLFESTLACGEMLELFEPLSGIFAYDVDFNRDIQPGDVLSAVLEKKYLDGKLAGYGDILAAELVNNGKAIRIVRYPSPSGAMGYFHPDGRSIRRQFLRCPLPFVRVTSRFGMRQHPVLGFSARHNGIDFGAPYGTPVRATAAGVIVGRGRDTGRGNYLVIRHGNGFTSQYFHMSRFARIPGAEQRVEQGQAVGYVGSTGLSTGPHLHYALLKNGRFLNPLTLQSPSVAPLPAPVMDDFRAYCERICRPLSEVPPVPLLPASAGLTRPRPGLRALPVEKTGLGGQGRD